MNPLKVKFKAGSFPKLLGELTHSNQFLKMFSTLSLCLSLGLLGLSFIGLTKAPVVIAVNSNGRVLEKAEMPSPENEVEQAVIAYVERRYNWTSASVDKNLDLAKAFISPQFVQTFVQGVSNVRKFSREKGVSQRAYATKISVDLKRSIVSIFGDRITEIQGMRAAGPFNLELSFAGGSRSRENPWGIYITKETEK